MHQGLVHDVPGTTGHDNTGKRQSQDDTMTRHHDIIHKTFQYLLQSTKANHHGIEYSQATGINDTLQLKHVSKEESEVSVYINTGYPRTYLSEAQSHTHIYNRNNITAV